MKTWKNKFIEKLFNAEQNEDELSYQLRKIIAKVLSENAKRVLANKQNPRIKRGFTHHNIDHKELTFTYYLN